MTGTLACVAGATVITLCKGPAIFQAPRTTTSNGTAIPARPATTMLRLQDGSGIYLIYRPLPVVVAAAAREASLNTMLSYELASPANINNLRKFFDLIKLLCRNKNPRKWRLESALVLVPSFMQFKFIA